MARSRPKWWDAALAVILGGGTIAAAARAGGCRRETVSRALRNPESEFAKELAQLRAGPSATAPGVLVEKAERVLEAHLDGEDAKASFNAAKVVVAKYGPQAAAQADTASTETEEATPEQAIRELVATLPTIKIVLREAAASPELVDELRRALRAALEDLDAMPGPVATPPPAPAAPPTPPLLN